LQLQNTLARHNNLLLFEIRAVKFDLTQSKAVPVCSDRAQMLPTRFEKHAIEVITNILLRHREMRLIKQPCQRLLRHGNAMPRIDVIHDRELCRRQCHQAEFAAARFNIELLATEHHRNLCAVRQRPANIQQLTTWHGYFTRRFNLNLLERMNRELGASFDVSRFRHYGTYDVHLGAMASYLVSLDRQTVYIESLEHAFDFEAWEPVHTEYSYKFLDSDIASLAHDTGFAVESQFYDSKHYFADSLWRVKARNVVGRTSTW